MRRVKAASMELTTFFRTKSRAKCARLDNLAAGDLVELFHGDGNPAALELLDHAEVALVARFPQAVQRILQLFPVIRQAQAEEMEFPARLGGLCREGRVPVYLDLHSWYERKGRVRRPRARPRHAVEGIVVRKGQRGQARLKRKLDESLRRAGADRTPLSACAGRSFDMNITDRILSIHGPDFPRAAWDWG